MQTDKVGGTSSDTENHALSSLGGNGDQPAVLAFTADDVLCWTYADMHEVSGRMASGLKNRGLGRDDTVAMLALPSPEYIAVAMGVFRTGATVVPIDAQMGDEALVHIINDCSPALLFTDERGARRIEKLDTGSKPEILRLDRNDGDDAWRSLLGDDIMDAENEEGERRAVIFYTSGTTGPPKGVPLSKSNLSYQIEVALDSGLIKSDDRLLLPLPLHHVYPFVIGMLAPLQLGLAIIIPSALTGPQLARAISESKSSIVLGVPRLHRALVDGIRNKADNSGFLIRYFFRAALAISRAARTRLGWKLGRILFGSMHRRMGGKLRIMASGGSPLDPRVAELIEAFGWDLAVGYGLTETSPLLTILRPGEQVHDSVGRAVPGTELRIDPSAFPGKEDDDGTQTQPAREEARETGEVLARGPGVFKGYHNLPDETEKAFTDGWYRTGDLGWFDDDGFLHLEGRVSTMLVLEGGENISPDKLEETYENSCEEIEEIGILQKEGKLVAVIVPREKQGEEEIRTLIKDALRRMRDKVPSYQRITDFKITNRELPRTRLGKIRRHKLEELYDSDAEDGGSKGPIDIEEMSSDDQSLLDNDKAYALWKLLSRRYSDRHLEPESRLETDLGIDSMEWVELSTAVEAESGIQLGDEVMEKAETVNDLLEAAVEASGSEVRADSRKAIKDPDSVLNEKERRWAQPRPMFLAVIGHIMYWIHQTFMVIFYRVEIQGKENLPEKAPYVLTPNHVSYLDGSAIISAIKMPLIAKYFWAGLTDALFISPFWRMLSRLGQVVPIDPRRGPVASLAFGASVIKRGHAIVWFPEGRRSIEGKLLPFRPGIGLILKEYSEVPVVPVYIQGTYEAWPVGRRFPRPGKVIVHIGKPLKPEELEKNGEGDSPHQRIANAIHAEVAKLRDSVERGK